IPLFFLFFFLIVLRSSRSTLFPYTTLFRSYISRSWKGAIRVLRVYLVKQRRFGQLFFLLIVLVTGCGRNERMDTVYLQRCISCRSEEHTSELQSLAYLVCRLLLEKKKNI